MLPPGHEPFLRAVCADPEDDTVRLVFADWLDEHGAPDRAEFIRLMVEHARRLGWKGAVTATIPQAALAIWKRNGAAWQSELPRIMGINWTGWSRGFRNGMSVNVGPQLFAYGTVLFDIAPVLVLTAHGVGEGFVERLVGLPRLEQIRELGFVSCNLGAGSWPQLAACPRLAGLRRLVVCATSPLPRDEAARAWAGRVLLTPADAAALAESPVLTNLEEVLVRGLLDPAAAEVLERRFKTVEHGLR